MRVMSGRTFGSVCRAALVEPRGRSGNGVGGRLGNGLGRLGDGLDDRV